MRSRQRTLRRQPVPQPVLREGAHLHGHVDGERRAPPSCGASAVPVTGTTARYRSGARRRFAQLIPAGALSQCQRGLIQERRSQRLLDLVGMVAAHQHERDVRFDPRHRTALPSRQTPLQAGGRLRPGARRSTLLPWPGVLLDHRSPTDLRSIARLPALATHDEDDLSDGIDPRQHGWFGIAIDLAQQMIGRMRDSAVSGSSEGSALLCEASQVWVSDAFHRRWVRLDSFGV